MTKPLDAPTEKPRQARLVHRSTLDTCWEIMRHFHNLSAATHLIGEGSPCMRQLRRQRSLLSCSLWLGLFVILWMAPPASHAQAQTCKCIGSGIDVWPNAKLAAPINTSIWVRLPAFSRKLQYGKYIEFAKYPALWSATFQLNQMAVGLVHKGKVLETNRVDLRSGDWRMMYLTPKVLLQPGETYQVKLQIGALSSVISTFKTKNEQPKSNGVKVNASSARYMWDPQVRGRCLGPTPYLSLKLRKALPQDKAPLMGVWLAPAEGKINYKTMPFLVLPTDKQRVVLGRAKQCAENNFDFASYKGSVTLGFRTADLSGNWGPPQTFTISIQHPVMPWTWQPYQRAIFWYLLAILIFVISLVRVWVFQRNSHEILEEFLVNYSSIKKDSAWMALRKYHERELPKRRWNMALAWLQGLLVLVGLVAFVMSYLHFSTGLTSMRQLMLTFGPLAGFVLLGWINNVFLALRISSKRKEIANLPVAPNFQEASTKLLKGWK